MVEHVLEVDRSQGQLTQTGGQFDFAIEGEGVFFELDTAQGPAYTRDGAFTVDPEGRLVTEAGHAVQGEGGEIILDPARGQASVAADGTITEFDDTTYSAGDAIGYGVTMSANPSDLINGATSVEYIANVATASLSK